MIQLQEAPAPYFLLEPHPEPGVDVGKNQAPLQSGDASDVINLH